jgi:hypothetical protein
MTDVTPAVAAPPQEKPSNSFSRMIGVLFSPNETFQEIARKPDFVIPAIVIILAVLASVLATVPHIDFDGTYREAFEAKGMSGPQMEQGMRFAIAFGKAAMYFAPFLMIGGLAVAGLIYFLGVKLFGGAATYPQVFSVVLYGFMPIVIKLLIKIPIVLTKQNLKLQESETVVRSSLAFLTSYKDHPVLFAFLNRIDAFAIWSLILIVIGLAAASRLSKVKTATVVILAWVLMTLFTVGGAAMGAMKK